MGLQPTGTDIGRVTDHFVYHCVCMSLCQLATVSVCHCVNHFVSVLLDYACMPLSVCHYLYTTICVPLSECHYLRATF